LGRDESLLSVLDLGNGMAGDCAASSLLAER